MSQLPHNRSHWNIGSIGKLYFITNARIILDTLFLLLYNQIVF